jgi:hypothetical protein
MSDQQPAKPLYLDYMDKEMNIMGILSTFCVAVVALVLDKVLGGKTSEPTFLTDVWKYGRPCVMAASALMLAGAYFFYRQRSKLAFYYGQICLCLSRSPPKNAQQFLTDADSWDTWWFYQTAFWLTGLAFLNYFAAICLACSDSISMSIFREHYLFTILMPIGVVFPTALFRRVVFHCYKYEDHPFQKFFSGFRLRVVEVLRIGKGLPSNRI